MLPVVGEDDDQGVLEAAALLQAIQEHADLLVGSFDLGLVKAPSGLHIAAS